MAALGSMLPPVPASASSRRVAPQCQHLLANCLKLWNDGLPAARLYLHQTSNLCPGAVPSVRSVTSGTPPRTQWRNSLHDGTSPALGMPAWWSDRKEQDYIASEGVSKPRIHRVSQRIGEDAWASFSERIPGRAREPAQRASSVPTQRTRPAALDSDPARLAAALKVKAARAAAAVPVFQLLATERAIAEVAARAKTARADRPSLGAHRGARGGTSTLSPEPVRTANEVDPGREVCTPAEPAQSSAGPAQHRPVQARPREVRTAALPRRQHALSSPRIGTSVRASSPTNSLRRDSLGDGRLQRRDSPSARAADPRRALREAERRACRKFHVTVVEQNAGLDNYGATRSPAFPGWQAARANSSGFGASDARFGSYARAHSDPTPDVGGPAAYEVEVAGAGASIPSTIRASATASTNPFRCARAAAHSFKLRPSCVLTRRDRGGMRWHVRCDV